MKTASLAKVLLVVVLAGCSPDPPAPLVTAPAPPGAWSEAARVAAAEPVSGEQFGYAIALSADGSTLAVGVPMNSSAAYSSGAAYVYIRSEDGWAQQAFIQASNPGANDQFGSGVALSADGNTLAVSAPFEDGGARGVNPPSDDSVEQSGAVYVFVRTAGAWSEVAYVKASNVGEPEDGDTFGYAIALSGDGSTLGVGAPGEDSAATGVNGDQSDNSVMGAGAVYVFRSDGDLWSQRAYLKGPGGGANILFGYSVALAYSGRSLAVGAYDEDQGRGGVHVFVRDGDTWSPQVSLAALNREPGDSMGVSVAMSDDGDTIAAGAADEDSFLTGVNPGEAGGADQETNTSAGAVYVFARTADTWSQQAFVKASNTGREDWFGVRLALSGDGGTLAVGAPNEDGAVGEEGAFDSSDDDSAQEAGAVYTYSRDRGVWVPGAYLKGSNTEQFDEFGSALAISRDGRVLAVGGRYGDSGSVEDSGAVYVLVR